jgi:hypothetical protein
MTQQEIANAEAFKRTQLNALIELEKKMYYNSFVVNCPQDKTGVADLLRDIERINTLRLKFGLGTVYVKMTDVLLRLKDNLRIRAK